MGQRQRRWQRKQVSCSVRAELDATATEVRALAFEALDVCEGGAFLKSDLLLETGDTLALELALPGVPQPIHARARIMWVRRFPNQTERPGMGVSFEAMAEAQREVLREFVRGPG